MNKEEAELPGGLIIKQKQSQKDVNLVFKKPMDSSTSTRMDSTTSNSKSIITASISSNDSLKRKLDSTPKESISRNDWTGTSRPNTSKRSDWTSGSKRNDWTSDSRHSSNTPTFSQGSNRTGTGYGSTTARGSTASRVGSSREPWKETPRKESREEWEAEQTRVDRDWYVLQRLAT